MGRAFFRIAFFVTIVSVGLLFFLTPGTAEFVVDVLALAVGLVFMTLIAILARWPARR